MTSTTPALGEKLGQIRSIPEFIQALICMGALGGFFALWQMNAAPVVVLIAGALGAAIALYAAVHYLPVLCSSLTIYDHGLEINVRGASTIIANEALTQLATDFTDHYYKHQYIGSRAKLDFYVDGRLKPHRYHCDFRNGQRSQRTVLLAIEQCNQAIQRRLFAILERDGTIPLRGNAALTAEGIKFTDSPTASRLIPYREISAWNIVEGDLKIWKRDDALPCLVVPGDTPNFGPLGGLFDLLCSADVGAEDAAVATT
jgi:hypothetical protein